MLDKFVAEFSAQAQRGGIKRVEFYIKESASQAVQVYKQEVERLAMSSESVAFIEGEYGGFRGSTFVEDLNGADFQEKIEIIKQIAQQDQIPFRPRPLAETAAPLNSRGVPTVAPPIEEVKEAEQLAYDFDQRIENVGACAYTSKQENIILWNDDGAKMEDSLAYQQFRISLVAREGTQVQTAFASQSMRADAKIDLPALVAQAAQKAVSQLEAAPVKTKDYAVILHNRLVGELVLAFLPGLYADRVQKKMSVLANRLGEKIAAPSFSLIEDPFLEKGIITRNFDDEGTPTAKKAVIDAGVLTTFFHNLETANYAKVGPTGNGFKRQYRERPLVSPTNVYVPGGKKDLAGLQKAMDLGLLITDCDGIFAGANPVSGDFSLIAKGYLIAGGRIQRPVNQITIGGNFYEMLKQIVDVGNDYATTGSVNTFVQTPSLWVHSLFVSGT